MELKPQVMGWGCVLLYIAVLPWLLTGSPRPLLGKNSYLKETRLEQYFYKKKDFLEIYEKAVKDLQLTKCSQIGLRSGGDHWEYPWWILLKDNGLRLEHLNGQRTTYPLGDFDPCAIITEGHEDHVIYKGSAYQKIGQSTMLSVLIKTPS